MITGYAVVDGFRVRYATGGRTTGRPVLLTSPGPDGELAFRAIGDSVGEAAPVFAVDLPGFGQPRAMGHLLVKLVQQFSLGAPHAVCPDLAAPAIVYAIDEHPGAFTSVQVLFGRRDPLVSPAYLELLRSSLRDVRVVSFDAGPFAWEDAAHEYAAAIRRWIIEQT